MTQALQHLIAALTLEPLGNDRWRGIGSRDDGVAATYGGHLLGQATAAAIASSAPGRALHSIHAYFLQAGEPGKPYQYSAMRVRDGRSFSVRRISAWQDDRLVLELNASLTAAAPGRIIKPSLPPDFLNLPPPETLESYSEIMSRLDPPPLPAEWARRDLAIDLRPVNAPWVEQGPSAEGGIRHWIRAAGRLPDKPWLHSSMLAYQSDESLADSLLIPFNLTWGMPGAKFASLDHAMWFHRSPDLNDWLFVEQWPGAAEQSRGLAHGRIWTRTGDLVCTFAQEAMMRLGS